jgi:hypothetical protein
VKVRKMGKRNRVLVVALPLMVILLGLIVYDYGYLKIRAELSSIKEMETLKTKTLTKYVTLIAEKPQLEKKLTSLKEKRKADDTKLIEGQTLSLSAATLQENVKTIITGRGGTISSERVDKPEDFSGFKVITISIDSVLPDTRVLSDILYAIETRTPYLVVKEVDARVRNFREPRELMVKLRVSALTLGK